MDGDSWSARLSSATKRYQSALQSRSGELDKFGCCVFFFGEEMEENERNLFFGEARQGMEEGEKLKFGNLQFLFEPKTEKYLFFDDLEMKEKKWSCFVVSCLVDEKMEENMGNCRLRSCILVV
ncbi:hypothetical protein CK203_021231 [Vitis vinifera]|uniref:Uncharacterized protein n=1 Tax=Vitis vinifera TaxID=29760 RepID=A0A438IM56_VITVI|nr:hypothetical protein CK203_021231 [Vitis vinifera]